jgi:hypothetical protein
MRWTIAPPRATRPPPASVTRFFRKPYAPMAGTGRLDVVDPDALAPQQLVILVELVSKLAEIGVPGGRRVVVLPFLRVLLARFVLGRSRHEDLAKRADTFGSPATTPNLLDLVVEVGLVEHPVAQRLAVLEPRQCLEDDHLVVLLSWSRRRVRELDLSAIGSDDTKGNLLARRPLGFLVRSLLEHGRPPFVGRSIVATRNRESAQCRRRRSCLRRRVFLL